MENDDLLVENLSYFRNSVLTDDWDCLFIVDGREGSGKSTFAGQIAQHLDKDNSIDLETQVAFTPDDFIKKALALPKGKAIIFDEARTGLNRRRSLSAANFKLTNFLAECRQLNLFIVIVLPYFHDLDQYIVGSRAQFLIHTRTKLNYKEKTRERGFYNFFNIAMMKRMFYDGRYAKYRSYLKNPGFRGRFSPHHVWNVEQYRRMKKEALAKYDEEDVRDDPTVIDISNELFKSVDDNDGVLQ